MMQDPAVKHLINVLLEDQKTRFSGGLERFLVRLATAEGRELFETWKNDKVTQLFLDALKSYSETCIGAYPETVQGLASAYGCLSGVRMAIRLMEDPTRVFPSVFDGENALMERKTIRELEAEYQPESEES